MASIFLGTGLILSTLWYAWNSSAAALSFPAILLRILLFAIAAGIIGKAVGIGLFRLRSQR